MCECVEYAVNNDLKKIEVKREDKVMTYFALDCKHCSKIVPLTQLAQRDYKVEARIKMILKKYKYDDYYVTDLFTTN